MTNNSAVSTHDRYRGALLGLAVGDALGVTNEMAKRGTFEVPTRMLGGGFLGLPPGAWTDDTSMALCIADSILESKGFDLRDQMERYVLWRTRGRLSSVEPWCVGMGCTTDNAIAAFQDDDLVIRPNQNPQTDAGNGAIMRLAPVPMAFRTSPSNEIEELCAQSAMSTHNVPACIDACSVFGLMIAAALNGQEKDRILNAAATSRLLTEVTPEVGGIATGCYRTKDVDAIKTTPYVVHTLEAALWCFHRTTSYREGLTLAISLGGDTDTVGAVYGQLAGAHYGIEAIPNEWIEDLRRKELLFDFADRLHAFAQPPGLLRGLLRNLSARFGYVES